MKSLFTLLLVAILFVWMISKCDSSSSYDAEKEYALTDAEKRETDSLSAVDAKNKILEEEERKKQEEIEDKRFYKSKAGRIHKKHPEWSRDDCELLANNRIWVGMTYSMLKYKRGLPNHANPSNYGNGTQWQWCWNDYTPSCFYDNNDDGVIDSYN